MLEIHYIVNGNETVRQYESAARFVARQQLEVPDIEDYYTISKVTVDGEEIALKDKTIGGLFNHFNN